MSKPYHLMTPEERLADRIAKNKLINQRAELVRQRKEAAQLRSNRRKIKAAFTELYNSLPEDAQRDLVEVVRANADLLRITQGGKK